MENSSNKKQTAIQYVFEQLYQKGFIKEVDGNEPINLMNKALQMEREQIENAFDEGIEFHNNPFQSSGDYFNQTFKL